MLVSFLSLEQIPEIINLLRENYVRIMILEEGDKNIGAEQMNI
jgi:hypothetical protein